MRKPKKEIGNSDICQEKDDHDDLNKKEINKIWKKKLQCPTWRRSWRKLEDLTPTCFQNGKVTTTQDETEDGHGTYGQEDWANRRIDWRQGMKTRIATEENRNNWWYVEKKTRANVGFEKNRRQRMETQGSDDSTLPAEDNSIPRDAYHEMTMTREIRDDYATRKMNFYQKEKADKNHWTKQIKELWVNTSNLKTITTLCYFEEETTRKPERFLDTQKKRRMTTYSRRRRSRDARNKKIQSIYPKTKWWRKERQARKMDESDDPRERIDDWYNSNLSLWRLDSTTGWNEARRTEMDRRWKTWRTWNEWRQNRCTHGEPKDRQDGRRTDANWR